MREVRNRGVDLHAVEPEFRHHLARGGDLRFGDTAVGLGHVAHDFEGRPEKLLADLQRARTTAANANARRHALIEEVAER